MQQLGIGGDADAVLLLQGQQIPARIFADTAGGWQVKRLADITLGVVVFQRAATGKAQIQLNIIGQHRIAVQQQGQAIGQLPALAANLGQGAKRRQ